MGKSHPNVFYIYLALIIVTLYVLFRVVTGVFYTFMPASYWFEWYSVVSVYEDYEQEDNILAMVDYEVKHPRPMFFYDRIMCSLPDGKWEKVHDQYSGRVYTEAVTRELHWFSVKYHQHRFEKRKCYIEAEVTAMLPNGTRKTQVIQSPEFYVGGKKDD